MVPLSGEDVACQDKTTDLDRKTTTPAVLLIPRPPGVGALTNSFGLWALFSTMASTGLVPRPVTFSAGYKEKLQV